jgi:hypothetical protein
MREDILSIGELSMAVKVAAFIMYGAAVSVG